MQAMVLAAGLGTRLWPLTEDRAKPAVPFLGKPLIAHVLELLERHGFTRAVVNTHHLPGSVTRAIGAARLERLAVAVSHEPEILGTAGGLARARTVGLLLPAPIVVVNAKLYTDLDLGAAVAAHAASGAAVTMVLRPNPERAPFREVLVEGGRVRGFGAGREPEGAAPLLFTGIHVLEPEVVAAIPERFCDTVADVYPPFVAAGRVHAHVEARGRWWEFSTLQRYLGLHRRAFEEGLGPDVSCSPGACVEAGAIVRQAVLWEDARVAAGALVESAVLGTGTRVPPGGDVRDAVLVAAPPVPAVGPSAGAPPRGRPFAGGQWLVPIAAADDG